MMKSDKEAKALRNGSIVMYNWQYLSAVHIWKFIKKSKNAFTSWLSFPWEVLSDS